MGRSLWAALAVGAFLAACSSTPDADASLREPCRDGDLAETRINEFGTDVPGGAKTAEEALRQEFQRDYPRLGPERFSRRERERADGVKQTVFAYDDADGGALVTTEFTGDSWHVMGYSLCGTTGATERR